MYRNVSALELPADAPPVTSSARRAVPPTSRPTDSRAPAAETSQATSDDQVTRTRTRSPRP